MTKNGSKLGRCRPCVLLSTTLSVTALSSLLVSVTGSLSFSSGWLSVLSAGSLGFFGFLTATHLVARFAADRAERRWRYSILRNQMDLFREAKAKPAKPTTG